ncbi:MAG: helix-hairpin-helix domain-containing protein, partial [Planctomycetaceae bacterium]|nr:helix-hairpin-helix domain-containing protein [Planctomycetaceae bacterium]
MTGDIHPLAFTRGEKIVVALFILVAGLSIAIASLNADDPATPVELERFNSKVKIPVNSCPAECFLVIGGIGEKRAQQIVTARERDGPFVSIDDMIARVPQLKHTKVKEFERYLEFAVSERTAPSSAIPN